MLFPAYLQPHLPKHHPESIYNTGKPEVIWFFFAFGYTIIPFME